MIRNKNVSLLLRLGLAFSFIYSGISAFLNPNNWIGFLPGFLQNESVLLIHDFFVILLGVWLVIGWKKMYSSAVSVLFLGGVVVFNFGALDIVYRDVSILLMAVALFVFEKYSK